MECVTQKGLVGDTNTLNRGGELKERKTAQREDRRVSTSSAGNTKIPSPGLVTQSTSPSPQCLCFSQLLQSPLTRSGSHYSSFSPP